MAAPSRQANAASSLPAELMAITYGMLPQHSLLSAAGVSSWWRSNAMRDPKYYRPWTIKFPVLEIRRRSNAPNYTDLDNLVDIIDDSEAHGYPLGLRISVDLVSRPYLQYTAQSGTNSSGSSSDSDESSSSSVSSPASDEIMEHNKSVFCVALLPTLQRAMARVAMLDLYPCVYSAPFLWDGLTAPAPLLRTLRIVMNVVGYEPPPAPLHPAHFLSGTAPLLTDVCLSQISLSPAPGVFPSVRRLELSYLSNFPDLRDATACFPSLLDLAIKHLPWQDTVTMGPDQSTLPVGLRVLRLGPGPVAPLVRAWPSGVHIPCIEYSSFPVQNTLPFLRFAEPLSVRIFEHLRDELEEFDPLVDPDRFTQLCFEIASTNAFRRIDGAEPLMDTMELFGISGCAKHVTQLTIDDRHLRPLIKVCGSMPALSALSVVLVTWHRLASDARPTDDEATLYRESHVRDDCNCLGGPFSDWHDGGPPDGDCRPEWPVLQSVELRATCASSTVTASLLRCLAEALTPAPARPLALVLTNGLALADDAQGADTAARFSEIRTGLCASLECVARAAALIAFAARKKVAARREMDKLLRVESPHFHWEVCEKANAQTISDAQV
ncbi:hypothetical protein AURDEDRAFT_123457 [Auricularia subglabra TFB-10046 SS5]|nr:hypothetical protein AURDEDRAFT_123457 [Auricularia subglabra TFB-10046 SS5]